MTVTTHDRAERIAEVLKAVAHPVRLRIIELLCEGEQHVNALAKELGITQPIASQQLRILRMHGLVGVSREAGFAHYRLEEQALRELVRCVRRCSAA